MENKNLIIIEDEFEIRNLIEIVFRRQGFQVTSFKSVEEFQHQIGFLAKNSFSLMILDWMLPGQSGVDFLKELRRQIDWKDLLVLMLTAKAEPQEVIQGLEEGADDYLVKPFDVGVLSARVAALLRRRDVDKGESLLEWRGLRMNTQNHEAWFEGEKLPLTPTEFKLLSLLLKNYGKVFTRDQLVNGVQGEGVNVLGRTVDTHIVSLRKKLGTLGPGIETARGLGYRIGQEELHS